MSGTLVVPFIVLADQPMNASQSQIQQPSYLPGEKIREGQLPGAYNESASYIVDDSWDVYFTGDFIYWQLNNHMSLGTMIDSPSASTPVFATGSARIFNVESSYKPGFQVGMGFDMKGMDDWNLYSEYTWYMNKSTRSADVDSDDIFVMAAGPVGNRVLADEATGTSIFHYNCADLSLQRNFYNGKKLTAMFGCGLRGRWINSKANIKATGLRTGGSTTALEDFTPESGSMNSSFTQHSWALGPRFELNSNWLLGCGFKIIGDISASILYTQYTKINNSYTEGANHYSSVNPKKRLKSITETSLGLGWGSYFGKNNSYHFDISSAYEFIVNWEQNYDVLGIIVSDNINIYGLNIAARLDF